MVVDDFNVFCVAVDEAEADAVLIVYSYGVLPVSVTGGTSCRFFARFASEFADLIYF